MTSEDFAWTFELAILTAQFCLHAFIHNVRHHSIYALVELAIIAVVNAGDLLNTAFSPVVESLIEVVLFSAVIFVASDCYLVHLSFLVNCKFASIEIFAAFRYGTLSSFFQVLVCAIAAKAVPATRV